MNLVARRISVSCDSMELFSRKGEFCVLYFNFRAELVFWISIKEGGLMGMRSSDNTIQLRVHSLP